jgi:hypothetical protein
LAGNQPASIASKNRRNAHVLLLLRGNSIDAACGIDRGWAGAGLSDPRTSARNDPAMIALKNCRNTHELVHMRRDLMIAAGCNDRGWMGVGP